MLAIKNTSFRTTDWVKVWLLNALPHWIRCTVSTPFLETLSEVCEYLEFQPAMFGALFCSSVV